VSECLRRRPKLKVQKNQSATGPAGVSAKKKPDPKARPVNREDENVRESSINVLTIRNKDAAWQHQDALVNISAMLPCMQRIP
jgi:hypothetical protein